MTDRHQARVLAMQALCQLETLGEDWLAQLDDFLLDNGPSPAVQRGRPRREIEYARQLVRDAWSNLARIDEVLQGVAENWELKRMAMVDRNILRAATCELLLRPDVPPKVVINEAVEVGKSFGAAESPAFINGILDAVLQQRDRSNPPTTVSEPLTTDH